MIEDDEAIGSFQLHENQQCGGLGNACSFCEAERMKCRICGRVGLSLCARCDYKLEELRMERLYDGAIARDIERGL